MSNLTILVAPTAYKGTFSPAQVARAIAAGISPKSDLKVILCPMADGGDGTIESIHCALGGEIRESWVTGPLGAPARGRWLSLPDTTIVELASASGLALLKAHQLRPTEAHTTGTGQLMAEALKEGEKRMVLAVGGSATVDGGTGALRALGATFFDSNGKVLELGGGPLIDLAKADLSFAAGLKDTVIDVATDVTNPLTGVNGAAYVFGPQKGADPQQVEALEKSLTRWADVLEEQTGRKVRNLPGSGAAGGTAFGLCCALGASIIPGSAWMMDLLSFDDKIAGCDLVISGEGRLDNQSLQGKIVGAIAERCRALNRPLWVLAGSHQAGVDFARFGIEMVHDVGCAGRPATIEEITRVSRLISERYL